MTKGYYLTDKNLSSKSAIGMPSFDTQKSGGMQKGHSKGQSFVQSMGRQIVYLVGGRRSLKDGQERRPSLRCVSATRFSACLREEAMECC